MISLPRLACHLAVLLTLFAAPALAAKSETSDGEDVALAFFKTAGTNPNFDMWAKNSKDYKTAAPARAKDVLYTEKQRLIKKWHAQGLDDVLTVGGMIDVALSSNLGSGEAREYWLYLNFKDGKSLYYPLEFQDYQFAVIPQGMQTLEKHRLQKEQYDLILADLKGLPEGTTYISLQLKPVKAYIDQPHMIDGREQWVLMCDIATVSLGSTTTKQTLWTYGADWYVSPVTRDLRGLYQKPKDPVIDEAPPQTATPATPATPAAPATPQP